MRTTLGDLKSKYRIAEALNIPPDDSRFPTYVNEAIQRMLNMGRWWGTLAKYSFLATSGMITLPRQIATIERVSLSHQPVPLRDMLYEFIENSWGTRGEHSGTVEALYRGRYPIFSDIVPAGKKVRVQCDLSSDVGKFILVLGFDDSGNWIRTSQNGVVSDGEVVALSQTPGTTTSNYFSVVTDLQAPGTLDGQWWVYELDVEATTTRMIGQYNYDDTRPSLARYFFPCIGSKKTLVECLVKLDFIPVAEDSDYCLIGNPAALKEMCMAIRAKEENRLSDSVALETMAVKLLDQELDTYLGAGRNIGINIISGGITSDDPIQTFI
jgi:hypothetical protein